MQFESPKAKGKTILGKTIKSFLNNLGGTGRCSRIVLPIIVLPSPFAGRRES
jgi:hypothetical protein